jgi:hypothetical protein
MTEWYLINNDGAIVRTALASTKREAEQILGPHGTIISALSWKHDLHRWKPVRTIVTDVVARKEEKFYKTVDTIKPGYLTVNEMAKRFDTRDGRIRRIVQLYGIPYEVVQYKGRKIQTYSPTNVARIRKHLVAQPERLTPRAVVEKRRQAYLERMRQYYLQKKHSHSARRAV